MKDMPSFISDFLASWVEEDPARSIDVVLTLGGRVLSGQLTAAVHFYEWQVRDVLGADYDERELLAARLRDHHNAAGSRVGPFDQLCLRNAMYLGAGKMRMPFVLVSAAHVEAITTGRVE